jgi:hypothetical protein
MANFLHIESWISAPKRFIELALLRRRTLDELDETYKSFVHATLNIS